jgi:glutamate racemase
LRAASPVPVIGAVEPGAKAALAHARGGHIGVIGTLGTVRSGAYERTIAALAPGARVTALACPLLVPLAEEGWTDDEVSRLVARRYLAQLFERDPAIDTLVLGCTHYPLLKGAIAGACKDLVAHEVVVVDSASAMAAEAKQQLGDERAGADVAHNRRGGAGTLECYATDISRLDELAPRFLGEPMTKFDLVDL